MTLSTLTNSFSFAGNGITTALPFNANFINETDLKVLEIDDVTKVEVTKVLATHYTVTGGNNTFGAIHMLIAPPVGKTIKVYREPVLNQSLDLIPNDRLPVEDVETSLDKITQIVQRFSERLGKAIRLREGFSGTFTPTLPIGMDTIGNAGKVFIINPAANGFDLGPTATQIANAQAQSIAAAASAASAAVSAAAAAASAIAAASAAGTFTISDTSAGDDIKTLPPASNGAGIKTYINKSYGSGNNTLVGLAGADTLNGGVLGDILGSGEIGSYYSDGISAYYKLS